MQNFRISCQLKLYVQNYQIKQMVLFYPYSKPLYMTYRLVIKESRKNRLLEELTFQYGSETSKENTDTFSYKKLLVK